MSESHDILLKVVVNAENPSQAVEALKCLSNEEAVESVKVVEPEVVQHLSDFLPHMGIAIEAAKIDYPDAVIKLGILATNPDGSGKVVAKLGLKFVEDLQTLLDDLQPKPKEEPRYIVTCKHNSTADGEAKSFKYYEDAMEHAILFWESYDLGYDCHREEPFFDPEGADSDVEVMRDDEDKVLSVVHANGDGPVIIIQLEST